MPLFGKAVQAGHEPPCDMWIVDADHFRNAYMDFDNALASSHNGTLMVADDASARFPFVARAWRQLIERGNVSELGCDEVDLGLVRARKGWEHNLKRWCLGSVIIR